MLSLIQNLVGICKQVTHLILILFKLVTCPKFVMPLYKSGVLVRTICFKLLSFTIQLFPFLVLKCKLVSYFTLFRLLAIISSW